MRIVKIKLTLIVMLLFVSCASYDGNYQLEDETTGHQYLTNENDNKSKTLEQTSLEQTSYKSSNDIDILKCENGNGIDEISRIPNFDDLNGSFFGNTSDFKFLTVRGSNDLFIAMDLGRFGSELYYFDYDGYGFTRMDFDFLHSIPAYVFIDGVRTLRDVEVRPNRVRGFYELNGEYFFLVGVHGMYPTNAGAIGNLISNDIIVFDDEGRPWFTYREWHIEKHLVLPGSPYTFFLDGEDLYIATRSQILLVYNDDVTVLSENISWNGRPNAMDKINNTIFIRTDHGIWSYDTTTNELNFNAN